MSENGTVTATEEETVGQTADAAASTTTNNETAEITEDIS
jgi:hypothetical protein